MLSDRDAPQADHRRVPVGGCRRCLSRVALGRESPFCRGDDRFQGPRNAQAGIARTCQGCQFLALDRLFVFRNESRYLDLPESQFCYTFRWGGCARNGQGIHVRRQMRIGPFSKQPLTRHPWDL